MHVRMRIALTQEDVYGLVVADLERVETLLASYADSAVEPVAHIGRYVIDSGGKRVRPALLLLTARALGGVDDATIRLAAVVELIHNATLVHDDVIDGSDTRRGAPSVNAAWGNTMTVLAGDWLYMQSFAAALEQRDFQVLDTLIEITQKMVEGELMQLTHVGSAGVGEAELLDIAERKTAYLFSGCTRLAAIVSGQSPHTRDALAGAGRNLGMTFQLVDDLLDLTSTQEAMGKPVARDLREGKVTLPVSYALGSGLPGGLEKVETVLAERDFGSVSAHEILGIVEAADGVERTRRLAADYAMRAAAVLETLPPTIYRDALLQIPEFILNRQA